MCHVNIVQQNSLLQDAKDQYFSMLREVRMHNNELSISIMLNYLVSSLPSNQAYSEYIYRLPANLINYITPIVGKKYEIDAIKNTIEAESFKQTEVSMTQFLCFAL